MNKPNPPKTNHNEEDDDYFEWAGPSKSQLKRDAHKLQKLGLALIELKPEQLALIPLPSALEDALAEVKSIKKNEALRRHHQLIGKLMRTADEEAITAALDKIKEDHDRDTRMSHAVEQWRDNLIQGEQNIMETFFDQFPRADRQQLRQLVAASKKEVGSKKPPTNARKLFKFIRDVITPAEEE